MPRSEFKSAYVSEGEGIDQYEQLSNVADRLSAGEITSVELVEQTLARIERLDGTLGSYSFVDAEGALSTAAELDARRGEENGPLYGVPIAVKDIYEVKGWPAAHGMPSRVGQVSVHTATVVKRLQAAGAIILGKVHTTEGVYAEHTDPFRAPLNPWDGSRWSGVSSSGSGVSTAAGLCYGALASDTGGSIRMPASANGLTGIKPTWGRVSRANVFELAATLDHVGTLTRSVMDGALMLAAIAGRDEADPTSSLFPVDDYIRAVTAGVDGLRVGIDRSWAYTDISEDVRVALDRALAILESLGATIVDIAFPDSEAIVEDWFDVCGVQTARAHGTWYDEHKSDYGAALREIIERGRALDSTSYDELLQRRARFMGEAEGVLAAVDTMLVPGLPFEAPPAADMERMDEETVAQVHRYTVPFTMSQLPTVTVPGGFSDHGLPVSVQFVGSKFDEATVLRVAGSFQSVTDWHKRHPAL
ncbi:amidase [Citricoccus sp. GCM10030269]|uniref:amidase n=1 Tax=Citricoccus sp. GCM10030269 TaxID=3273388 RepID=UPI003606EC46